MSEPKRLSRKNLQANVREIQERINCSSAGLCVRLIRADTVAAPTF